MNNVLDWRERDALLLPDTSRWGRGYGGKSYTEAELGETRGYIMETMAKGGWAGYEDRGLLNSHWAYDVTSDGLVLPPGFDADSPGRVGAPPLKLEPNNVTTLDASWRVPLYLEKFYRESGALLDQHGRWVHPHVQQIVEADIPICTGYGVGWEGGETVVVDTVVDDGDHVLLLDMPGDDRNYSLVGGYTYAEDFTTIEKWRCGERPITLEGIKNAVYRIVEAKAGFSLAAADDIQFDIVWGVRPWSSAHTANFGTVTYTVKVTVPKGAPEHLTARGNAFWQTRRDLKHVVDNLWPDHRRGFEAAMA